jgi:hypothetical protein
MNNYISNCSHRDVDVLQTVDSKQLRAAAKKGDAVRIRALLSQEGARGIINEADQVKLFPPCTVGETFYYVLVRPEAAWMHGSDGCISGGSSRSSGCAAKRRSRIKFAKPGQRAKAKIDLFATAFGWQSSLESHELR